MAHTPLLFMFPEMLHIISGIFANSTLQSSSQQAEEINRLVYYFCWGAGFILLVVTALTAYMVITFRQRKGISATKKQVNKKWEIAMIGVPTLLVAVFFYLTIKTMRTVLPSVEGKNPDVIVIGHQWWWQTIYPSHDVIGANEIHLPAGRPILLELRAADVIHDWWVPSFGNKMDMVPGRENYLWLTIKEPGTYIGACSEFCGAQHAGMRLQIIAQSQQDYDHWLSTQQQQATIPNDTLVQTGAQLFAQYTCGSCHRINGTDANGEAGPDLTHIGSRKTLLTGLMTNNPNNLTAWLKNPQQIKPGAHMPNFFLDEHSLKALTAYLTALK